MKWLLVLGVGVGGHFGFSLGLGSHGEALPLTFLLLWALGMGAAMSK